jgi:hypothetical protein
MDFSVRSSTIREIQPSAYAVGLEKLVATMQLILFCSSVNLIVFFINKIQNYIQPSF